VVVLQPRKEVDVVCCIAQRYAIWFSGGDLGPTVLFECVNWTRCKYLCEADQ